MKLVIKIDGQDDLVVYETKDIGKTLKKVIVLKEEVANLKERYESALSVSRSLALIVDNKNKVINDLKSSLQLEAQEVVAKKVKKSRWGRFLGL